MKDRLLHTPEGVRDIYDSECERKNRVLRNIQDTLHLYGNMDIETPSFEFFQIFNHDRGSAPSNEMYKFFDRSNNTLVLRPDITPSIARSVAKYYPEEELPIRLSYTGHTFMNAPQHQGKLHETTQIGCELINDDSSAADAEMLACMIDCLKAAKLPEFQIVIGEMDFFKGLIRDAGLGEAEEAEIRGYLKIKNYFGLSEYLSRLSLPDKFKNIFSSFDRLFGGEEILLEAEKMPLNRTSLEAVERLKKVYQAVSCYGYEKYLSFDLGMVSGYHYYTGIVFRAFTHGTGNPVASGGRYNMLLSQFGKDAPSIGFVIAVDELMNALSRQKVEDPAPFFRAVVVYPIDWQKKAVELSVELRNKGIHTGLIRKSKRHTMEEYYAYAARFSAERLYTIQEDGTVEIRDQGGNLCDI